MRCNAVNFEFIKTHGTKEYHNIKTKKPVQNDNCRETRTMFPETQNFIITEFVKSFIRSTKLEPTNCPRASTGQRYPCPAISCSAKARCRQGSGPNRGRCSVEHWGKFRPSIHPSPVHPSVFCRTSSPIGSAALPP